MADVTVRYWAGAREAAGHDDERVQVGSVRELVQLLCERDDRLAEVVRRSSLLVDGRTVRGELALANGQTVEVLPPFAGG